MNLLDEFRDRSGAGAAIRPSSNGGAALRDVLAAAGAPTATLSSRTRRMLWLALATLPIVAVAHPFLLALMSGTGNGSDPFSFAAGLLAWPGALVQPVLVAAAALAVIALAFVTRGFRAASRTPIRAATTSLVVGAAASVPLVLVVLAFLVIAALAMAVVAFLVWLLISAMSS